MKEQETISIKKKKVKNMLNAEEFPFEGEKNFQPSLTIPDQTMPLRELIDRFTRGLPVTSFKPVYDEDNSLPDPRKMDLAEYNEMRKNVALELKNITEKQQLEEKQRIENQRLKEIEEEVQRRISTNTP